VKIDTHRIKSAAATEIYIKASVSPDITLAEQAIELFGGIRRILESEGAHILQERIFGTEDALKNVRPIRKDIYAAYDDSVEPAWLVVPEGINGQFAGVQVHALSGIEAPKIIHLGEKPCGRMVHAGESKYLALSFIQAPEAGQASDQARAMLEKAEAVLKQEGCDMHSVPRTWIWLKDILSWYDKFNSVRNSFFTERGLIGNGRLNRMPASTGIGISPGNGAICGMDLVAVIIPGKSIEYLDAGGNQNSAFKYGSAFSRASRVETPAGTTVYVSGTASIDTAGKTTNIGNASKQIEASINNVRAVLREMQCNDVDVVQATAYCKTVEIEKLFWSRWSDLAWPNLSVIADICRDDLLFEIEAAAVIAKDK
jgi:enamine deaminase RidA (YjgF/YER057c/UK114 family)